MSDTKTLIQAMRILAHDIQSDDGVANAAIAEAADRLQELGRDLEVTGKQLRQQELLIEENLRLKERIKRLEMAGNEMAGYLGDGYYVVQIWNKAVETKP